MVKLRRGRTYRITKPDGDFYGDVRVRSISGRLPSMKETKAGSETWYHLRFIGQEDGDENDWFEAKELAGLGLQEIES
jgi:hypothetical protein